MDLISVIVPVYKVEPYLDRCVQSIVDQTYTNLEIILVDDGSPDNCGAMCDSWAEKDSRIKVIHKENGGLSDARNAGMAAASGEYMAFVDSDDWVDKQFISVMYQAIVVTGADIAACDILMTENQDSVATGSTEFSLAVCTPEEAIEDITYGRRFRAVVWNKLYKRNVLAGEYFSVGRYHEDEFFTYRILDKATVLVFADQILYYYYQRSGSIMGSVSVRHLDAFDAYLERLAYLKKKYPRIYVRDKMQFCVSCVMHYRDALTLTIPETSEVKKRLVAYRKCVTFEFAELREYTVKQLVYIIGTRCCMDAFCKILNLKTGRA